MAETPHQDKKAADAGAPASAAQAPSRRDDRDTLPLDITRKISAAGSAPSGAGADQGRGSDYAPPHRSVVRRFAEDFGASTKAWVVTQFSREQLVAGLKSLAWVLPLTVLIWIYAEREQLYTVPSVTVPIRVVHTDPSRVVTVLDPPDGHLLVTLKGPRGEVEAVQEQFRDSSAPVAIELERDVRTGELTIRADRVGMDRRFADRGVTVSNAQPGTLRVKVEPLVEKEVDVRPARALDAVHEVKFVPPVVKIRLPDQAHKQARLDDKLHAYAELPANHPELVAAVNGGKSTVTIKDLPLTLQIENDHARILDVKTVTAEVNLKAQREFTFTIVPVWMTAPKDFSKNYEVEYNALAPGVTVVGPEEQILKMSDPEYKPAPATFWVSAEDARPGVTRSAPLQFNFPQGVKVKPGPDGPPAISYTLKKIGA